MLNSRNNFIRNYLSVSLSEHHMATLASIIKEVDKDGLKGQSTGYCFLVEFGCRLGGVINSAAAWMIGFPVCLSGSSDEEFAAALYHFNHSLVTSDLQSPNLQVCVCDDQWGRELSPSALSRLQFLLLSNTVCHRIPTVERVLREYSSMTLCLN